MKPTHTYIWVDGELVEVFREPPGPRVHLQTDRGFDNLRATDGTPINSRSKWSRYMKENNLTLASDWTESWDKAAAKRESLFKGGPDAQRHATIEKVKKMAYEAPEKVIEIAKRARERPTAIAGKFSEDITK